MLAFTVALAAATPAVAQAGDLDGFASLLGVGVTGQAHYSGLEIGGFLYPRRDAREFDKLYFTADANMAAPGLDFEIGLAAYRRLTIGLKFGFYPVSASGPAAPGTGTETIGGSGISVGWIAKHTPKLLVHPVVYGQFAGNDPYYGARWGVEVHAFARVLRLGTLLGRPLWFTARVSAGASTATIKQSKDVPGLPPASDNTATYSRTFVSVGVTPIDMAF